MKRVKEGGGEPSGHMGARLKYVLLFTSLNLRGGSMRECVCVISLNKALVTAFGDQTCSGVCATSGPTQSAAIRLCLSHGAERQSYQAIKKYPKKN